MSAPARDHAPSWYAATADIKPPLPSLEGGVRADVAVVGGGFTGLSAALHLAEAGARVVLLEANRLGWGASGRNGGQLVTGQRRDQDEIERAYGRDVALRLFALAEEAKALVHALRHRHGIDCEWRSGYLFAVRSNGAARSLRRYVDHLNTVYDYACARFVDAAAVGEMVASPRFRGGFVDSGAGHLHPLKLALGLADAARAAGARLHEGSHVRSIAERADGVRLTTGRGHVDADHVLLAGNGYLANLEARVERRVMPIESYMVATEPLGPLAVRRLIRDDICVTDDQFAVNYFRTSGDHRLLFGGGETYGYRTTSNIAAVVRPPLEDVFPSLRGVCIDYAWSGRVAITRSRLPYLRRLGPRLLAAGGYSGQGVALAVLAGKLMATAVRTEDAGFAIFARLPHPPFPGGRAGGRPLLALVLTWLALRDRLSW